MHIHYNVIKYYTLLIKTNLNILFITTLILGTLISISATNWLGIWVGLELNMLSFIPILNSNKNILTNEASLKYFLIQAVASIIFICSAISNTLFFSLFNNTNFSLHTVFFINIALLLKLGAAPFHAWFISIINGISWINCFLLITWQKITPLCILTYLIFNHKLLILISSLSLLVGSIGGLNQTQLKKILAFSSVNHLGWIFTSMILNKNLFSLYFFLYIFINAIIVWTSNLYKINSIKHIFTLNITWLFILRIFSLGGLPPFLGFLPKLLILQALISKNLFLSFTLVITTLVTLFYYLRLTYISILLNNSQSKKPLSYTKNNSWHPYLLVWLNTATIFGLFLWNLI